MSKEFVIIMTLKHYHNSLYLKKNDAIIKRGDKDDDL